MARLLVDAIQNGDTASAKDIIKKGNYGCIDGQTWRRDGTALFFCCSRGYLELAAALIEKGASVNSTDKSLATPLHGAVDNGHLKIVKLLLENGAKVNSQTSRGDTPLHLSAYRGYKEITQCLVESGADRGLINVSNLTAQREAFSQGHTDISNYLMAIEDVSFLEENHNLYSMIQLDPPNDSDCVPSARGQQGKWTTPAREQKDKSTVSRWQTEDTLSSVQSAQCQPSLSETQPQTHLGKSMNEAAHFYDEDNSQIYLIIDPPPLTPTSPQVCPHTPSTHEVYPHIHPTTSHVSTHAPTKYQLHSHSPSSPQVYPDTPTSPQVYPYPHNTPWVYPHTPTSPQVYPHTPTSPQMYPHHFPTTKLFPHSKLSQAESPITSSPQTPTDKPQFSETSHCLNLGEHCQSSSSHTYLKTRPSSGSVSDISSSPADSDIWSFLSSYAGSFDNTRRKDNHFKPDSSKDGLGSEEVENLYEILGVRFPPDHERAKSPKPPLTTDFSNILDVSLFSLSTLSSATPSVSTPFYARSLTANPITTHLKTCRASSVNESANESTATRPVFNKSFSVDPKQLRGARHSLNGSCLRLEHLPSNDLSGTSYMSVSSLVPKTSSSMTCINIPLN